MTEKQCTDCGTTKPIEQFYSRQSACKPCVRVRAREYYEDNKEECLERHRRYKRPPRKRDPIKRRAQGAVQTAVKNGSLTPSQICERCNLSKPTHGHHEDYSKPLDVIWLCRACHGERHREINQSRWVVS